MQHCLGRVVTACALCCQSHCFALAENTQNEVIRASAACTNLASEVPQHDSHRAHQAFLKTSIRVTSSSRVQYPEV